MDKQSLKAFTAHLVGLSIVGALMLGFAYYLYLETVADKKIWLLFSGSLLFTITSLGYIAYCSEYVRRKGHSVLYVVLYTLFYVPHLIARATNRKA